jgi:type 1 glutamine amidotransferase
MILKNMLAGLVMGALLITPTFSQIKPAASTSKLKRVLHYRYVGWFYKHTEGQKDLTDVLNFLAKTKGFEVVIADNVVAINPANLKTFQAIVWDNNIDGLNSIPDAASRQAVLDYVNGGGGWVIVHGAGDHKHTWAPLQELLKTEFTHHGDFGPGDITIDAEAIKDKELKWMVKDLPPKIRLTKDEWYSFLSTVRGKDSTRVVAIEDNGVGTSILPFDDKSATKDQTYIWAKNMGKGRTIYTSIGHGGFNQYAQADSFCTKSLYENLRFVAGDYQNGCTNANAGNFNPLARVDDGSCLTTSLNPQAKTLVNLNVTYKGDHRTFNFPHDGAFTAELRKPNGVLVWKKNAVNGSLLEIDGTINPGVFYLTARNRKSSIKQKLVLF